MEKQKIIVGLSGGVDSSVAAYLLKEEGYEVIGVTMVNFREKSLPENAAGSQQEMTEDAKRVADFLGIAHYVADLCSEFKEYIIDYFINEYLSGRTPNPCVVCNRYIKWKAIMEQGEKLGARLIATGHYAQVEQLANGRYALKCSVTAEKRPDLCFVWINTGAAIRDQAASGEVYEGSDTGDCRAYRNSGSEKAG